MREVTLDEVRQLLSSPAATGFFEAWAQAASDLADATERRDMLVAQVHAAESRVVLAQEVARLATVAADEQRRRALAVSPSSTGQSVLRMEAEALARVHLARARTALDEARERRLRASSLSDEVAAAQAEADACRTALRPLRDQARQLGAMVGESCLFFADATAAGAVFVVPLERLAFDGIQLDAYVLHRHPGHGLLALAEPVRDARPAAPSPGGDDPDPDEEDAFATPSEGSFSQAPR